MYAEISSAIVSAKAALELAQAAQGLANFNELVSAVSEVNTKLMAAYDVAFASSEKAYYADTQVTKHEYTLDIATRCTEVLSCARRKCT